MKKKVAFFVFSLETGGIERYLLRFLTHYKEKIDATIYCKSGKAGVLKNEFENIGSKVELFKVDYFVSLKKLKNKIKENQFETVVDFTNNFAAFTLLSAKQIGIKKRIVWYRNADFKFKKTPLRMIYNSIINKITRNVATDILSNSKSAFNVFYRGYNWEKDSRFEVIYNGIDSEKFLSSKSNLRCELNIPNNAFVIGHIGRYDAQKNHKTAIEVAIRLCKEYNDIYFIFVGRDVDTALIKTVKKHNLESKILLFGNRSDIPEILNTLNCFYFPSIVEGQPNALIEAMISGLPFVASNIEPIKEAVPKDLHPFLLSPLDVTLAVQTLLNIKTDNRFKTQMICTDWAIQRYNAEIQFDKFLKKL